MSSLIHSNGESGFIWIPIVHLPFEVNAPIDPTALFREPFPDEVCVALFSPSIMQIISTACSLVSATLYVQLKWMVPVDTLNPFTRLMLNESLLRVLYASFPRSLSSMRLVVFPPDLPAGYVPFSGLVSTLDFVFFHDSSPLSYDGFSTDHPLPCRMLMISPSPPPVTPGSYRDLSLDEVKSFLSTHTLTDEDSLGVCSKNSASQAALPIEIGCVGGTFDHLHSGHQILLTMTAIACTHLELGVTSPEMLVKKQFAQFLESPELRASNVIRFLKLINPSLSINLSMLLEHFGPILTVSGMQRLVVSQETSGSLASINAKREALGFKALEFLVIGLISPGSDFYNQEQKLSFDSRMLLKTSSTQIRERLAFPNLQDSI